jgi:hypothetical protein
MEALIASMSALGEDENRPPHMVLAPDFLASSDTVFHPGFKFRKPLPQVTGGGKAVTGLHVH